MSLDIRAELKKIEDIYNLTGRVKYGKFLIYGPVGTGKTRLASTCPKPVLVHSFDPGGTTTIRDHVGHGITIDDSFEAENNNKPTQWQRWVQVTDRMQVSGMFDGIGTYVLDSLTTWSDAAMNEVLRLDGRPGQAIQLQDYNSQYVKILSMLKVLNTLPCHVLVTAHIEMTQDEVTGRIISSLLATGKMKTKIPLLFSEMFLAQVSAKPSGLEYSLLTRNNARYSARTRIGADDKLDMNEPPDIKNILKKGGLSYADKDGWGE